VATSVTSADGTVLSQRDSGWMSIGEGTAAQSIGAGAG
jgi:hypothetical protein